MVSRTKSGSVALCAVLIALSLALSLVDTAVSSAIPFLPGLKIGLANIVTLWAIYTLGFKKSLIILIVRCILAAVLSGFLTSLAFSLAGGIVSFLVMYLLKQRLSVLKLSVVGAVCHNMMQILVAGLMTQTVFVSYYIPVLIITGSICGFCMGMVVIIFLRRIKNFK